MHKYWITGLLVMFVVSNLGTRLLDRVYDGYHVPGDAWAFFCVVMGASLILVALIKWAKRLRDSKRSSTDSQRGKSDC